MPALYAKNPEIVSTHSRPKAAGAAEQQPDNQPSVSTHSRPKAAGYPLCKSSRLFLRFNSQPPEGGWNIGLGWSLFIRSFNSQPPEGGWVWPAARLSPLVGFNSQPPEGGWFIVLHPVRIGACFNSQPPEGGWAKKIAEALGRNGVFQLTAARRRLD